MYQNISDWVSKYFTRNWGLRKKCLLRSQKYICSHLDIHSYYLSTTNVYDPSNVKLTFFFNSYSTKSIQCKTWYLVFQFFMFQYITYRIALGWHRVRWHWWHWSITMSQCLCFSLFHKHCDIVIDQCHQCHPTLCHPSATHYLPCPWLGRESIQLHRSTH